MNDPHGFYDRHLPSLPAAQRAVPRSMSARKVEPFLEHVRAAHSDPKTPGFTTVLGWVKKFRRLKDWSLMAPRYDRRGSDEATVIVGPLKRIVEEQVRAVWMTNARNPKCSVCDAVEAKVLVHNRRHAERPIGVSRRQLYRYISDNVDRREAAIARFGKTYADREFSAVFAGPGAEYALEIVEVDHTQSKLEVVDDITGTILGRPWITAALDRHTRLVVGLHVHFDGPSLNAALQCLRNAMTPKRFLKELVPSIDYAYPVCGRPVKFFFDRGDDFDSDFIEEVCVGLDINMQYAPGERPQLKGTIERFNQTMHAKTALNVRGALPRVTDRVRDARPRASQATLTLSEYTARLWFWATMVYAKEFHEGLGDVPLDKWRESTTSVPPRPVPTREKLDLYLLRAVRCKVTRKGVQVNGLRWNDRTAVPRILGYPGGDREVLVRIDDNDLGRAFITDPISRRIEPLEPVLTRYMPGTTWHQHELVKRKLERKRHGAHSESSLVEARYSLLRQGLETFDLKTAGSKTKGTCCPWAGYRRRGTI